MKHPTKRRIQLTANLQLTDKLLTAKNFSERVELEVNNFDGSYLDTLVYFSEQYDLDAETIASLLTPLLKERLEAEAKRKHLVNGVIRASLRF